MEPMPEAAPIVEMRRIKKSFGAVQALRGVDLVLHQNEVLGLVGDNAAGKSTLMKVLSGAYIPDEGEIFIEGKKAHIGDPMGARRLGIEMVYQDFALANNLDVAANVFLGREAVSTRLGPIGVMNRRYMEVETQRLLDRLKIDISSVRLRVENSIWWPASIGGDIPRDGLQCEGYHHGRAHGGSQRGRHRQGSRLGAAAQGGGQFDHHHQSPPGRRLPSERPNDGAAPRAEGLRLSRHRRPFRVSGAGSGLYHRRPR